MPLMGTVSPVDVLPNVPSLRDGSNHGVLGIVISHPHVDDYGMATYAHASIPIYVEPEAEKLLRAAAPFTSFGTAFANASHYRHRTNLFRLTPYLVDHSAFDAYALLIETDGASLFYSCDLRGHGRKHGSSRA